MAMIPYTDDEFGGYIFKEMNFKDPKPSESAMRNRNIALYNRIVKSLVAKLGITSDQAKELIELQKDNKAHQPPAGWKMVNGQPMFRQRKAEMRKYTAENIPGQIESTMSAIAELEQQRDTIRKELSKQKSKLQRIKRLSKIRGVEEAAPEASASGFFAY